MKLTTAISVLLASTALFSSGSEALPAPNNSGKKIVVPLHTNAHFRPNPSVSVRKAHFRYSKFLDAPDKASKAPFASKISVGNGKQVGDIALKDIQNDVQYVATVEVGTPPQKLDLNPDTGSADLWLISTLCKKCDDYNTKFDPKKSTTYKGPVGEESTSTKKEWNIRYGDGSTAGGYVGYDVVNLGGLPIENQAIELATHETQMDNVVHGIMGLAFPQLCTVDGIKTPLENLQEQGLIKDTIFSFWLGKYQHGGGGELIFGGYNKARFEGKLTQVPVRNIQGYWGITVNHGRVGNQLIPWRGVQSTLSNDKVEGSGRIVDNLIPNVVPLLPAILDTGTTLMIFPPGLAELVASHYDATPQEDGTYIINCDLNNLPEFTLNIGGSDFTVPSESMIYYSFGNGTCIAGFAKANFPFAILGDVFLKNVYSVFDFGSQPSVYLAKATPA
ncbi:aspartic peptidase domain-containing protein [Zychaea mexicana]|uniref:aspartic peptidase domain-containing protein n=1 Tax=Zychaea mexicana TaxID=64656 RepID=UPI0022FE75C7|nr:aspartic peptidase domain-containing protein [Zychaea mexicana]KAI9498311.1 aspartic peptidase domain-containing protein [Zychaea mexicana]